MADRVTMQGLDKVARALRELPGAVAKTALRKAVLAGAIEVRNEARSTAPVDTGRLRRNIIVKFISERSSRQQVTYYVLARSGKRFQKMKARGRKKAGQSEPRLIDNDAFYWRFMEFGTSHIKPTHFMTKAFAAKRTRALGLITDLLREGIDQSVRGLK